MTWWRRAGVNRRTGHARGDDDGQGRLGIALEERADDYAVARVGAEPVVRALEKLADLNMRVEGRVARLQTQARVGR